jgi:hypothetical protein
MRAYQRRKLEAVGSLDRLRVVVGIDAVGVGKPDPRMFHRPCEALGVAPGEAAYVGDELDVDARAARGCSDWPRGVPPDDLGRRLLAGRVLGRGRAPLTAGSVPPWGMV